MADYARIRVARIRQRLDVPPEMGPSDLAGLDLELTKARQRIARYESVMQRDAAPARRATNRDPLLSVVGR